MGFEGYGLLVWSWLLGIWLEPARPHPSWPPGVLLVLLGLGLAVTRGLLRWPRSWARLAISGLGLLIVGVGTGLLYSETLASWARIETWTTPFHAARAAPGAIGAIGLGLFAWWRGIVLSRGETDFDSVLSRFRWVVGGLIVALLLAWFGLRGGAARAFQQAVGPLVAGTFCLGLLALALSRLEDIRAESRSLGAGARPIGFNRQWFALVVGLCLTILIGAFVLGQALGLELGGGLVALIAPLADALTLIVVLVAAPPILLAAWVAELLTPLLRALHVDQILQELIEFLGQLTRRSEPGQNPGDILPTSVIAGALWLIAGLILGLLGRGLWRAIRRRSASRASETDVEEVRESLWSWPEARAGLAQFFRDLLARLFRRRPAPASPAAASSAAAPSDGADARALYRCLLRRAAAWGRPRLPQQTPHEFERRLASQWPDLAPSLHALTDAYVRSRYAESAPTDPDLPTHWAAIADKLQPEPKKP